MKEFSHQPGEPFSFILASDAALTSPDYFDDHIWELTQSEGEPAALVIRNLISAVGPGPCAFFQCFSRNGQITANPINFHRAPRVIKIFPNYASLEYSPFHGVDVLSEYWVPDSHTLAGRIRLGNPTATSQSVRFSLAALLIPVDQGTVMQPSQIQVAMVLSGQVSRIFPVLFLTGGPASDESNPYSALAIDLEIAPGAIRQFTWAQASLESSSTSFEHARRTHRTRLGC